MYRKILLPLDGSTFAEFASPFAAEIARRAGSDIEVVTVHDPVPPLAVGDWERSTHLWQEEYLELVGDDLQARTGGGVTRAQPVGKIPERLAEHVEAADPDLVVMATHGRGPLSRFWLGSVADHLVRHASCPLLLVRPSEEEGEEPTPAQVRLDRLVVALDGSEESETVLDPALDLAELFGADVVLVRIVPSLPLLTSSYLPETADIDREILEEHRAEAEDDLEKVAARLRDEGRRIDTDVRIGHPPTAIQEAVREHGGDLVALSTHGRGGVRRTVLGSVADKVIRGSDVPVLVQRVRPGSLRAE